MGGNINLNRSGRKELCSHKKFIDSGKPSEGGDTWILILKMT